MYIHELSTRSCILLSKQMNVFSSDNFEWSSVFYPTIHVLKIGALDYGMEILCQIQQLHSLISDNCWHFLIATDVSERAKSLMQPFLSRWTSIEANKVCKTWLFIHFNKNLYLKDWYPHVSCQTQELLQSDYSTCTVQYSQWWRPLRFPFRWPQLL